MVDILLVDDNRDILAVVKNFLELEGMRVCCATSGEDALRKIETEPFRLMITDLDMPGINGLELAQKSLKIAPAMPIIMSTGNISQEIPLLALDIGITKVLVKPFHPNVMLEIVTDVMEKAKKFPYSEDAAREISRD